MTKIIITGARGRMGRALLDCANRIPEIEVAGQVDLGDHLETVLPRAEVVVDFSLPTATLGITEVCARQGKAMVIGTTGHEAAVKQQIQGHQSRIPIVWAANFSTGVNALFWLTRKAAEILGPEFDREIIEIHHRHKKDAPSGTAATLAEILAHVRGPSVPQTLHHGRRGIVGERTADEIGIHSLRGGDVVGDHTVVFAAPGERLELTHKTSNRDNFANGALRAAQWVINQPPGLYNMLDVLGLH